MVRFSQALGFDGYPELQQAAIEEYRHKVSEGAPNGNGGSGAAALFNFDHSEFEASLGADYSNIEETARNRGWNPRRVPKEERDMVVAKIRDQFAAKRAAKQA